MPVIDRDGLAAATEFALPPPDMERFAQFSETPIDPTETTSIEQGVAEAAHALEDAVDGAEEEEEEEEEEHERGTEFTIYWPASF